MDHSRGTRKPTRQEVELEKIHLRNRFFESIFRFGRFALVCLTVAYCVNELMGGVIEIAAGRDEKELKGLAYLIEAMNFGDVFLGLWGIIASVAWRLERTGKKRQIQTNGELRKRLESNDAYRSTSGLDKRGDDPEEESD